MRNLPAYEGSDNKEALDAHVDQFNSASTVGSYEEDFVEIGRTPKRITDGARLQIWIAVKEEQLALPWSRITKHFSASLAVMQEAALNDLRRMATSTA